MGYCSGGAGRFRKINSEKKKFWDKKKIFFFWVGKKKNESKFLCINYVSLICMDKCFLVLVYPAILVFTLEFKEMMQTSVSIPPPLGKTDIQLFINLEKNFLEER